MAPEIEPAVQEEADGVTPVGFFSGLLPGAGAGRP